MFKDICHAAVAVGDYPAALWWRTIVSAYCSGMFFQVNFCFSKSNLYSRFLVFQRKMTTFYYCLIFWSNFTFAVASEKTKTFALTIYMGMYINTDICIIKYVEVSWYVLLPGNIEKYKRANLVVKRLTYLNWYTVQFFHLIFTMTLCKPQHFRKCSDLSSQWLWSNILKEGFQAYSQFLIPWECRGGEKALLSYLVIQHWY